MFNGQELPLGLDFAEKHFQFIDHPVMVIDYDTDGADPADLDRIRWRRSSCGSSGSADAYVHGDEVVETCLTAGTQKRLMEAYA